MSEAVKLTVRNLPRPTHRALVRAAAANRRPLNSEIVVRLEESIRKDGGR